MNSELLRAALAGAVITFLTGSLTSVYLCGLPNQTDPHYETTH